MSHEAILAFGMVLAFWLGFAVGEIWLIGQIERAHTVTGSARRG